MLKLSLASVFQTQTQTQTQFLTHTQTQTYLLRQLKNWEFDHCSKKFSGFAMEPPERTIQQLGELSAKYAEAQRNAQKAMALFKETRDENEELRNNFDTLKQAFQALQGRFRDSQAAHTATQQEVMHSV